MKFYAPHRNFRAKVHGRVLLFPYGSRTVADSDLEEIKAIKSIPIKMGEIRDVSGEVVNRPPIPKPKPKPALGKQRAATSAKLSQKAKPQTEPG